MNPVIKVLATLAVITMAVGAPAASLLNERSEFVAVDAVPDWQHLGVAPDPRTGLIVLCFPGAGCIVCHQGYCEYTGRPM